MPVPAVALACRACRGATLAYMLHQLSFDRKYPGRTCRCQQRRQFVPSTLQIPKEVATLGLPTGGLELVAIRRISRHAELSVAVGDDAPDGGRGAFDLGRR
jgi:hypothetical protein